MDTVADLFARMQAATNAPLEARLVKTRAIYTDAGSGADRSVATYEPIFPDDADWGFFGHVAVELPSKGSFPLDSSLVADLAPYALIVKAASLGNGALCRAGGSGTKLWTDQHSKGNQNIEIYAPTPEVTGYEPLGLFASIVTNYGDDPRSAASFGRLVFVRSELLVAIDDGCRSHFPWIRCVAKGNGMVHVMQPS